MLYYTVGQIDTFLAMFLSGLALGAWTDIAFRLSALLKPGRILTFFLDAVCVAGLFFILLFALFRSSRLELRLFSLLSSFGAMALYLLIVPPVIDAQVNFIKKIACRLYGFHNLKKIFQFLCR
ncbi:MAG: hypothetical protein IJC48_04370 [Clostridia bacterium]|nr:hypothetical protein [Clostridia bacterium]